MDPVIQLLYLVAGVLFILALMWMSHPSTSRRGVMAGQIGMLLAIVGTLLIANVVNYELIFVALLVGSAIGAPLALLMPMTAIPQRTALSHAFGALAIGLIGTVEYYKIAQLAPYGLSFAMIALIAEMLLGFLTFTASLFAFAKLQELVTGRPIILPGQQWMNLALFIGAIGTGVALVLHPEQTVLFPIFVAIALAFGLALVAPIGGADMPTVIALLNSYAGLAASAMGFALDNKLLIVTGALDGASGFVLAVIMCRAMNRSFANVLFGGFGQVQHVGGPGEQRPVHSASPEEAASILESASSVVIVPGYGMAVSQAQHRVNDLFQQLTKRGVDVKFAIHPVAGRMPGHMNVLLAEADIPYDCLAEMEDINGELPQTDVALVIGANDVVNPSARDDPKSSIGGMPIIEVDRARTVMVVKRSMNPGFAGIDNELYYLPKTQMLFGDAKEFIGALAKEIAALNA